MNPAQKYPVIADNNPIIQEYAPLLNAMVAKQQNKMSIDIPPSAVNQGDIGMISQLIAVAQQKKEWIEILISGIKFKFLRYEEVEDDYLEGPEWATDPTYQQWFFELGRALPLSSFFLHNIESRLFTINGDFFGEVIQKAKDEGNESVSGIKLSEEELKLTNMRLFWACISFYTYCNQTGFDAQPHIENFIKEIQGAFTFEQLKDEWLKNDYRLLEEK